VDTAKPEMGRQRVSGIPNWVKTYSLRKTIKLAVVYVKLRTADLSRRNNEGMTTK